MNEESQCLLSCGTSSSKELNILAIQQHKVSPPQLHLMPNFRSSGLRYPTSPDANLQQ